MAALEWYAEREYALLAALWRGEITTREWETVKPVCVLAYRAAMQPA